MQTSFNTVEPHLPTFSQATGLRADTSRLPAYRVCHRARFHPYPRYAPIVEAENALFNTIFDDEQIAFDLPPTRPVREGRTLEAPDEEQRALEHQRRIRRLEGVMAEFIDGVKLALFG